MGWRKNLLWDMRPPGPLADSKMVTETPFLARLDAQTAPETAQHFLLFTKDEHFFHCL
jgi:hypothetical protein